MKILSCDAKSILNEATGFLEGFTHSINPAIGCLFGQGACGTFCYAKALNSHLMRGKHLGGWGEYLIVKENAVELLRQELERASRRNREDPRYIEKLAIFASPATEPLLSQTIDIYRGWLQLLADYPIRKWVIQTRSPLVLKLREEIERLGNRVCINFTLETDSDTVFTSLSPGGSPLPSQRRAIVEEVSSWSVTLSLAVSPCLPIENVESFADWISKHADYALVDTFVAGDGTKGRRTRRTDIPKIFMAHGWNWEDESQARELLSLLQLKMGPNASWSHHGFVRLASG
jgi:DNA repair photolyase